jgi:hypothetical protein
MELSSVFGGDTLKAADLQGYEANVVIASVEQKKFDNGNKLILKFIGKKKALVCNKTNAKRIAMMHGTNTDAWTGKPITLYVDIVDFQGEPTEAIRVRVERPSVARPADHGDRVPDPISTGISERAPQPPVRRAADPDDDIPF